MLYRPGSSKLPGTTLQEDLIWMGVSPAAACILSIITYALIVLVLMENHILNHRRNPGLASKVEAVIQRF